MFLCSYTKSCQYSIIKDGADWISNRFLDIDASGPNAKVSPLSLHQTCGCRTVKVGQHALCHDCLT